MSRTTRIIGLCVAILLAFGVASCEGEKKSDDSAAKEAPKPEPKDPKALFEGTKVDLVGPLAKVSFGMTEADALTATGFESSYGDLEEYPDVSFGFYAPDDTGKVSSMRVSVEVDGYDLVKTLTELWGEPSKGSDLEKDKYFWFNPEKKIRASIHMGYGKEREVEYTAYLPAAELIGSADDKGKLGFESHPLLGSTGSDLKTHFGDYLVVLTKEQAERQREQLEKFMGEDLSALGDAIPSTDIDLPPTEYGSMFTRVNTDVEEGKVVGYRVSIDFDSFPPAKDTIFELLKAKWGEPTKAEDLGREILVFNEDPRVVVREDTISGAWEIRVEQAEAPTAAAE